MMLLKPRLSLVLYVTRPVKPFGSTATSQTGPVHHRVTGAMSQAAQREIDKPLVLYVYIYAFVDTNCMKGLSTESIIRKQRPNGFQLNGYGGVSKGFGYYVIWRRDLTRMKQTDTSTQTNMDLWLRLSSKLLMLTTGFVGGAQSD